MSDLQQRDSDQQNIENSGSDIQTRIHGGGAPVDDLESSDTQQLHKSFILDPMH